MFGKHEMHIQTTYTHIIGSDNLNMRDNNILAFAAYTFGENALKCNSWKVKQYEYTKMYKCICFLFIKHTKLSLFNTAFCEIGNPFDNINAQK